MYQDTVNTNDNIPALCDSSDFPFQQAEQSEGLRAARSCMLGC